MNLRILPSLVFLAVVLAPSASAYTCSDSGAGNTAYFGSQTTGSYASYLALYQTSHPPIGAQAWCSTPILGYYMGSPETPNTYVYLYFTVTCPNGANVGINPTVYSTPGDFIIIDILQEIGVNNIGNVEHYTRACAFCTGGTQSANNVVDVDIDYVAAGQTTCQ